MKDPFEFWERNGKLEFQRGDVRVYRVDRQHYLFVDQTMYASTTERPWYIRNVMPYAKGRVLEIGLGLGCASKVILANPKVQHLLTIENNENVIAAYGRLLPKHHLLLQDAEEWAREVPKNFSMFDLIFVDHYTFSEDTIDELKELAQNLCPLVKEGGRMIFWVDENAPEEDKVQIKNLWLER
jgi:spermidine synthase